jgi:hypothetical protein
MGKELVRSCKLAVSVCKSRARRCLRFTAQVEEFHLDDVLRLTSHEVMPKAKAKARRAVRKARKEGDEEAEVCQISSSISI